MGSLLAKTVALSALCVLLAGCAQTGPPLPPSLELPKAPGDLRASRKGNRVTLTWSEPTQTTDHQGVRYLGPTLVCREAAPEMASCGPPVATVPAPISTAKRKSKKKEAQKANSAHPPPLTFVDTLPTNLLQPSPTAEITYAVEVLNRNDRSAGLSNRVHVPAVITLPPPSDLGATLTGDGVVLGWTESGKAASTSASSPGIEFRYRIYRFEETAGDKSSGKDVIAGEVALGQAGAVHFTDSGFEWEKTSLYHLTVVTVVKRSASEVQVEGDDSPQVRVVAHDIFPPSVPVGLQAVYSGEGQKPFIDLIWAPVTNADLAGYNVFRSEGGSANIVKLNSELVKPPSYRDFAVMSGKIYTYAVSAVDMRGNESARSAETSESVP